MKLRLGTTYLVHICGAFLSDLQTKIGHLLNFGALRVIY